MSAEVENPTPLASRPGPVQAWEYMAVEADDEDAYLRDLAGVDNLDAVSSLRLSVNTSTTTISHLGAKLPHLQELNLTGSVIESIRDLGTGFQGLQVLWVSRCGLPGLDGLSALPCLRELYAAYNDIADLQPLDSCQMLEVLDMEGNCIDDAEALHALSAACPRLQSLTLAGNPISSSPGYHTLVTGLLRSLSLLDDTPVSQLQLSDEPPVSHTGISARDSIGDAEAAGTGASAQLSGVQGQRQELQLVQEGIKHARVGVDSHEFRELEMTLLMAADLPPDMPAPSPAVLPASAGSWLRCSQQGSLPSMQRARSQRSADAGGSPRTSHDSSASVPQAGSAAGSRPESSSGHMPPGSPQNLQRLSSGIARPPSARPGTASLLSNRPSTSAPPTAGVVGGLYWRKNRLSSVRPHASGGGTGGTGLADDDDDDGIAAGSILTFGVSKGATMGANLARDLRRRKNASLPSSRPGTTGGPGDAGPAPLQPLAATGAAAKQGGQGVASSYDSAGLLEELRRWKVETADRVLLPTEDEATSGIAWPHADEEEGSGQQDGADRGSSAERVSGTGRLPPWQELGALGEEDGGEGASGEVSASVTRHGAADVLRLGSAGSASAGEADSDLGAGPGPGSALATSQSLQQRRSLVQSPPAAPLSPVSGGWLASGSVSSPCGKPPLAPLAPHRNGKLSHSPSQDAVHSPVLVRIPSAAASPPTAGVLSPSHLSGAPGHGSALGPPSIPIQGLGPVQGHRPARPSKMLLCKVLLETTGRVVLTNRHSRHSVSGTGQESLSIKSRPLGAIDLFQSAHTHANPLFMPDGQPDGEGAGGRERGVTVVSCCGEIDIRAVNPTPVTHIEDDDDSSDDEIIDI